MIDWWNACVIGVGCMIIGIFLARYRDRLRDVIPIVTAFIVGMAFHSVYLHEKMRHRWKHPWDHKEKETIDDGEIR